MKILIVDDERVVSDFFAQLARVRGYTDVDTVSTGEEALTQVIRTDYDLITLDIQMPGVSGLEIIAMLRNMCPHAILALISGYIPEEVSSEVAGCADVMIPKPVGVDTFTRLLEGVEQIHQARERIRSLGIPPSACR
ncbi:MAG: response regulator [Candidatus Latescibacterota bacterium]